MPSPGIANPENLSRWLPGCRRADWISEIQNPENFVAAVAGISEIQFTWNSGRTAAALAPQLSVIYHQWLGLRAWGQEETRISDKF